MRHNLLAAFLVALPSAPALAWSAEGHEAIAALAARQLTPKAADRVRALLGTASFKGSAAAAMIADSNWADEIRDRRPETARWHYVNIPVTATGYDPKRDCRDDDCAVARIERFRGVLADHRQPRARRAEALRFLIHLVGDIHQPLHAADNNDRGGNDIHLRFGGQRTNMHHLWDMQLVEASSRDPLVVAGRIAHSTRMAQWRRWQTGTPVTWANESFHVAQRDIYAVTKGRRNVRLAPGYAAAMTPVVQTQLARAGARLAWLLNRALN